MRQLTHIRDGQKIAEYLLDLQDVVIGRGHAAHIQLDGNSVVSRQHALIRAEGNGHVIEDLGGANGTFVDGREIKRHVLRAGQRIVLGSDTLRYDFGHRGAQSLRGLGGAPAVPVEEIAPEGLTEIDVSDVESFNSFEQLGDLGEVNRGKEGSPQLGAERTQIADKDELEVLLQKMNIKAKPHLQKLGDDDAEDDPDAGELIPLSQSPVFIGHTDDCGVRLPGKRWLLPGKIAGRLTNEAGRWHITPESTFWNPIHLGDDKLEKIRMLESGDFFWAGGIRFVYRRGL